VHDGEGDDRNTYDDRYQKQKSSDDELEQG